MTAKEVLDRINKQKKAIDGYPSKFIYVGTVDEYKVVVEALEKQIPKKPKYEKWLNSEYWYCPACNEVVLSVLSDSPIENEYNHSCCGGCGQALEWG